MQRCFHAKCSDGAYLTSFGIVCQTEEETNDDERSLCAGLLRRDMVCALERVLLECGGFFCTYQ